MTLLSFAVIAGIGILVVLAAILWRRLAGARKADQAPPENLNRPEDADLKTKRRLDTAL